MCVFVFVCVYVCERESVCMCVRERVCVCVWERVCVYVWVSEWVSEWVSVFVCVYVRETESVCVYVCERESVCVYMCEWVSVFVKHKNADKLQASSGDEKKYSQQKNVYLTRVNRDVMSNF